MEAITSGLTGKTYDLRKLARVADRRLQTLYIKNGIMPVEMYWSQDRNERDIIIMLFPKNKTTELYKVWKANNPKKGEADALHD